MTDKSGSFRKKKIYFSQVSNEALRDSKLSLKAKGLYALIQSYITIEDFTLYKGTLKNTCIEGDTSFDNAWNELKDMKYLKQYKLKGENGIFYYEYELLDKKETEIPDMDNQGVGNAQVDDAPCGKVGIYNNTDLNNTDLNNTDLNNTDNIAKKKIQWDKILIAWNDLPNSIKPIKAITDRRKDKIKARINSLNLKQEDIIQAISNIKKSSFLQGKNNRNWIIDINWLFQDDTRFCKVLEGKYNDKEGGNNDSPKHKKGLDESGLGFHF